MTRSLACISLSTLFGFLLLALSLDIIFELKYQPILDRRDEMLQKKQAQWFQSPQLGRIVASEMTTANQDFQTTFNSLKNQLNLLKSEERQSLLSMQKNWLAKKIHITNIQSVIHFFLQARRYNAWTAQRQNLDLKPLIPVDFVVLGQALYNHLYWTSQENLDLLTESIHHFAILLLQTQHLDLNRAGLSLLEKGENFRKLYKLKNPQWTSRLVPLGTRELQDWQKDWTTLLTTLSPLSRGDRLQATLAPEVQPSFCSVYLDQQPMLLWSLPFIANSVPFEANFKTTVDKIEVILDHGKQHCEISKSASKYPQHWIRLVPFYRRIYITHKLLEAEGYNL